MNLSRHLTAVLCAGALPALSVCTDDAVTKAAALVGVLDEPAGAHCAAGGLAVRTGIDENGDGTLAEDEVTSTEYVCNGATGQTGAPGEDGHSSLVATTTEPAGSHCANGGVVVSFGLDLDGNGVLDTVEITATHYVCNGADGQSGASSLVSMSQEPAGANCAAGGQAIRAGVDDNRDGLLQPEEVDQTSYVCNGEAGQAGVTSLVRQEDEPAGANCAAGGRRILSGRDADANGYLDAGEVTATSYVCNGAPGAPAHASLFNLVSEAVGTNCAAGGTRVESGLDANDDGVLQPSEVTQTRYVCNGLAGADGHPSLVATTAEPAGSNCVAGGYRVDTGVDSDGDGTLDAAEITQTRYVCNGPSGLATLVTTTPEPAGTNCTNGGQKVVSGLDDDGDGVLQATEIDSTSYVCHGGNVVLRVSNAVWGGVCARGGVKVETGVDDDGNGILEDAEVDRTQYVCNLYYVQVTGGSYHSCALVSDRTVRCWGNNFYSQLGDGTAASSRVTPVAVSGLQNVVEISAGHLHTCARLADGTAECWGYNSYGQLGDGSQTNRTSATPVSGLSGAIQIAAGWVHTCALLSGGTVACWGDNAHGQLGDGTFTSRTTPAAVVSLTGVAHIAPGGYHTCARSTGGSLFCWGSNTYGQLGDGTTITRTTATAVPGVAGISEVSAGGNVTCFRTPGATAYCWGENSDGQVGDGTTTSRLTPVLLASLTGVTEIDAGARHSCARLADGSARCWGYNLYGQLGDGTLTSRLLPVGVSELFGAQSMALGGSHSLALMPDGTVLGWGDNAYGQVGDGTTTKRLVPEPIASGSL